MKDSNNEEGKSKILVYLGVSFIAIFALIIVVLFVVAFKSFDNNINSFLDNIDNNVEFALIDDSVDVYLQDQHSQIIDLYMHDERLNGNYLTSATNIDDKNIYLSAIGNFSVGEIICLKEKDRFYQGYILNVVNITGAISNITMDTPLDYSFSTTAGVCAGSNNLAVDGSVTPKVFKISPKGADPNIRWDITRIIISIVDDAAMDPTKFGSIANGITNGIVLRSTNGITKNIFNVKYNADFAERAYDITYDDRASPLGEYALRVRRSFAGQDKNGVTIRLAAAREDELQMIVYDDLTDLSEFEVVVQGHVVED